MAADKVRYKTNEKVTTKNLITEKTVLQCRTVKARKSIING